MSTYLKSANGAGHLERWGEMRSLQSNLVRKVERKRSLGRPGLSCDDNIKIDIQELIKGMDSI
jgi:hypothetical protein